MEKDDDIPELFNVKLHALSEFNDFLKNEAVQLRNKRPLLFKDKFMMKKNLKFLKNNYDDLLERTNSDLLSFSMSQQIAKQNAITTKRSKSQNNIKLIKDENESEEECHSIGCKKRKKEKDPDSPSFLTEPKKLFTATTNAFTKSFNKENINNMNNSLYNGSYNFIVDSNDMKTINSRLSQNKNNGMNPSILQNDDTNYDKNNGSFFNNDTKSAEKNSKIFSDSKYKDDLYSTMAPKSDLKSEFSSSFKNNHNYNWFYDKKINGLYEELRNMENELNLKSAEILKLQQEKEEACEKIKKKSKAQLKEKNKQIKELNEKIIECEEIITNNKNNNNTQEVNLNYDELTKIKEKNLELEKYIQYLEHKNAETVKKFEGVKKNLGDILSSYSKKLEELSEQEIHYSQVIKENSILTKEKDELKKRLTEISKIEKHF